MFSGDLVPHKSITSLNGVFKNPRQSDLYVFDIDDVLFHVGRNKYEDKPVLSESEIQAGLNFLKETGHRIILLTARDNRFAKETIKQLQDLNITYDDILHAPSTCLQDGTKVSNKGEVLAGYLKTVMSQDERIQSSRLIVIDDEEKNLDAIETSLKNDDALKKVKRCLYHYTPDLRLLEGEDNTFPINLNDVVLSSVKSLGGGTQSTFELNIADKTFVLKYGAHEEAMQVEILMNGLYQALGVPVPKHQAYKRLPHSLLEKLHLDSNDVIVQLAEKVYEHDEEKDLKIERCMQDFMVHAFLGNIDLKEENMIGKKIIDAGANCFFRALGQERLEVSREVTEIDSLRDPSKNTSSAKWFSTLSDEDLKSQAISLLSKRNIIEQTLLSLTSRLNMSDALQKTIIDGFSSRLDAIAKRFDLQVIERRLKSVSPYTSAGIFTLRQNKKGKWEVLLSKRSKHNWYDNLGGKSDEQDITLMNTARREVYEESNGELDYSEESLSKAPFYDMETIDDKQNRRLYRLYFAKSKTPVPIEEMVENEHTHHGWFDLEGLLSAVNTNETIKEENKETIKIQFEDREIILFPPLYDLLKKVKAQNILRSFITKEGGKLKNENMTASLETVFSYKEMVRTTLFHKSSLLQAIKRQHPTPYPVEATLSTSSKRLTQSEMHLKMILGDEFNDTGTSEENIRTFFKIYKDNYPEDKIEDLISICVDMIEQERRDPTKIYLYHGCDSKIAFIYDLYSRIYQQLRADDRFTHFRVEHPLFNTMLNIHDFIKYFSNEGTHRINNYHNPDFMRLALSVNLFLLGNHNTPSSHSLAYFLNGEARYNIDLEKLLEEFFQLLNIPSSMTQELFSLYKNNLNHASALYQLVLEPSKADKHVYTAGFLGRIEKSPDGESYAPSVILNKIRDVLETKEDTTPYERHISDLQARLMAPPHLGIESNVVYSNESVVSTEYKKGLKEKSKKIVGLYLAHHEGKPLSQQAHPLVAQYNSVLNDIGLQPSSDKEKITYEMISSLINDNKQAEIISLAKRHPEILTDSVLKRERLRSYIRGYSASRSASESTFFDLLILSAAMTECIYTLYGERFFEGRVTEKNIDNIYQHIKPNDMPAFAKALYDSDIDFHDGSGALHWAHDGMTVLHWAVHQQDIALINLLIQADFNINVLDWNNTSSLLLAFKESLVSCSYDVVYELIALGADVNLPMHDKRSVLMAALDSKCPSKLLKALLDADAKIDYQSPVGKTALMYAIESGNIAFAHDLLAKGADIHLRDERGRNVLLHAIKQGQGEFVQTLLRRDADINSRDNKGQTALMYAIRYQQNEMARSLLAQGAKLLLDKTNDDEPLDYKGQTLLIYSIDHRNTEFAQLLLKREVDIDHQDRAKKTALMYAVESGDEALVHEILLKGPNVNCVDVNGETALLMAIEENNEKIVDLLLQHNADVNMQDQNGETPLMMAAKLGSVDITQKLIQMKADIHAKDSKGMTPLMHAVFAKNKAVVTELLKSGAKVNAESKTGDTSLLFAARVAENDILEILLAHDADVNIGDNKGIYTPLMHAIERQKPEMVDTLLKYKAHINILNAIDETPLILAAEKGEPEIVKRLIDNGAEVNLKGSRNSTALVFAVANANRNAALLLLEHDADPNCHGYLPERLIIWCIKYSLSDVAIALIKHGASIEHQKGLMVRGTLEESPFLMAVFYNRKDVVKAMIEAGVDMNYPLFPYDSSALLLALKRHNLEIAHMLIDKKIQLEIKDASGQTALMYVFRNWNIRQENTKKIILSLIENGANPNCADFYSSPLVKACIADDKEIVTALLEHGAKLPVFVKDQKTVFDYAVKHNHTSLLEMFIETNYLPLNSEIKVYIQSAIMTKNVSFGAKIFKKGFRWNEQSILKWSLVFGQKDYALALISSCQLINTVCIDNYTPLMYAAHIGDLEMVRDLIQLGADPSIKNDQKQDALSVADQTIVDEIRTLIKEINREKRRSFISCAIL